MLHFSYFVEHLPWLLLGAVVLAVSIFIYKGIRTRKFYAELPTAPHSLFWGNLKTMGEATAKYPPRAYFSPIFTNIAKENGMDGIYYMDLWPFSESFVFLLDPDLALQAQTSPNFTRHPLSAEFLGGLVGTSSLFATHGKEWQQQRSWFASAFSLNHILTLVPGMIEEVLVFKEKLTQFAVSNKEFIMLEEVTKLTMDVIGRSVGDIKLNSQKGYSGIQAAFQGAIDSSASTGDPIWRRAMKPVLLGWYTWKLDRLLMPIIKQKFASGTMAGADAKSILGLAQKGYMKHRADEKGSSGSIEGDREFMKVALDNAKTFFTGGFDTTSSTVTYMYYLLANHSEILARVRAEHDELLGATLEASVSTLTSNPSVLSKLPLTSAVLKETLRLYPIGFTIRQAQPGTTLSYKGRDYPMDNHYVVAFSPYMHRNPTFWHDPEEFDPDRWLQEGKNIDLGRDNGAWQAFERGPRNCIGQQLALIEARVIAVLTLRFFDFEPRLKNDGLAIPGWGDEVYQIFKMTAKPKDGIPMVVKLRDN